MQDMSDTDDKDQPKAPDTKEVEPGSDADETPAPEIGKTPRDPNKKEG